MIERKENGYINDHLQDRPCLLKKEAMKCDSGSHYRKYYKGIQLDPYRIADVYGMTDHALFSALKKILAAGQRGNKDSQRDITEARDALNRKLEMITEDS